MPVSGFPNQTACVPYFYSRESNLSAIRATQEDEMGQLYLTNVDFLKNGIPASVIAALVCVTLSLSSSIDRTLIAWHDRWSHRLVMH
jgi:phosphate transporter